MTNKPRTISALICCGLFLWSCQTEPVKPAEVTIHGLTPPQVITGLGNYFEGIVAKQQTNPAADTNAFFYTVLERSPTTLHLKLVDKNRFQATTGYSKWTLIAEPASEGTILRAVGVYVQNAGSGLERETAVERAANIDGAGFIRNFQKFLDGVKANMERQRSG